MSHENEEDWEQFAALTSQLVFTPAEVAVLSEQSKTSQVYLGELIRACEKRDGQAISVAYLKVGNCLEVLSRLIENKAKARFLENRSE